MVLAVVVAVASVAPAIVDSDSDESSDMEMEELDDVQRQFVMVPGQACQYCGGTECESGPTNESYCKNCVDAYYEFIEADPPHHHVAVAQVTPPPPPTGGRPGSHPCAHATGRRLVGRSPTSQHTAA